VTTGLGGANILDKDRKQIIGLVWQIVRLKYLQIIGSKTEKDLITWANESVKDHAGIKDLKDKSLSDSLFLIHLCAAIEPRAVNWDIIMKEDTDEARENNAKYLVSICRKLGAVIFCVWEDIVKVNYKMILVLVCSLYEIQEEMKASQ
jgi:plastin-1